MACRFPNAGKNAGIGKEKAANCLFII